MEHIYPITDFELSSLSFSLGFLLVNMMVYFYIYRKLREDIDLALLSINCGAYIFVLSQLLIVFFFSMNYNSNTIVNIYLANEMVLGFLGLSWIFYIKSILTLNQKFIAFLNILSTLSLVFIIALTVFAFMFPEMLVTINTNSYSVTEDPQHISIIAETGVLHLIRNVYLVIISIITVFLYLYEIFVNKTLRDRNIALSTIAFIFFYIFSIDELQASYTNKNMILDGLESSRLIIGITIFIVINLYTSITNFILRTFNVKKNKAGLITNYENYEDIIRNTLKTTDNIDLSNKNTKMISVDLFIMSEDIFGRINALKSSLIKSIESNGALKKASDIESIDTNMNSIYMEKLGETLDSIEKSITERNKFIEESVSSIELCINTTYKLQDDAKNLSDISIRFKNNTLKTKQKIQNSVIKMEAISQISSQIRRILIFMKNISDKTAILSINSNIQASKSGEWSDSFLVISVEVSKLIKDISDITYKLEKLLYGIDTIFKEFYMQKDTIIASFSKLVEYTDFMAYDIKNIALDISAQNDYSSNAVKNIKILIRINRALESIFLKDKSNSEYVRYKMESLDSCFAEISSKSIEREKWFNNILNDINKLFATSTELKNLNKEVTQDISILDGISSSVKSKTFGYRS